MEINEEKVTKRWHRYVDAINFCIRLGYYIETIDSVDNNGRWNGNIKAIKVRQEGLTSEYYIPLKPKKYTGFEMLRLIMDRIPYNEILRGTLMEIEKRI